MSTLRHCRPYPKDTTTLIGLSYEISIRMTEQHPNTLESAISAAIDIERVVSKGKGTNRWDDPRSEPCESNNLQSCRDIRDFEFTLYLQVNIDMKSRWRHAAAE